MLTSVSKISVFFQIACATCGRDVPVCLTQDDDDNDDNNHNNDDDDDDDRDDDDDNDDDDDDDDDDYDDNDNDNDNDDDDDDDNGEDNNDDNYVMLPITHTYIHIRTYQSVHLPQTHNIRPPKYWVNKVKRW